MHNIYDFTLEEFKQEMVALNQKEFRAVQLFNWLYIKEAKSFDEMSDVSIKFRDVLKEKYSLFLPKILVKQESLDGTIKLLLEMEDGAKVETVLMRYDYGNVLCVTSQVGCNMGCAFCASGLLKKQRDLKTYEIVSQVMVMNSLLEKDDKISHIVVMGTGEPFDNYDNVMRFIHILNCNKGLNIGARHITVSTSGLTEKIKQYGKEGLQVNLAISLHAPNNELRSKIMKINRAYPLEKLVEALKQYQIDSNNRRLTFEYIMLAGVNDNLKEADELVHFIKDNELFAYVNLIPYNEVKEMPFKRSDNTRVHRFMSHLKKNGINVTVRKEFGTDIDAACGQLRAKKEGIIEC